MVSVKCPYCGRGIVESVVGGIEDPRFSYACNLCGASGPSTCYDDVSFAAVEAMSDVVEAAKEVMPLLAKHSRIDRISENDEARALARLADALKRLEATNG